MATFNVEWFFTTVPAHIQPPLVLAKPEEKAARLAATIANLPEPPEVIALQEIQGPHEVELLCVALRACGLEFEAVIGLFSSKRTGQRVALLHSPQVSPISSGSFSEDSRLSAATRMAPNPVRNKEDMFKEDVELLEKNVYLECSVMGRRTLIVNVHLKARNDPESCATRIREAAVLQGCIEEIRGDDTAVIILGDFNDGDPLLEVNKRTVFTPVVETLRRAHKGPVSECWKSSGIKYGSAAELLPVTDRVSTVSGKCIDHILVDERHLKATECHIARHQTDTKDTPLCERVSDHYPVLAHIIIVQPTLATTAEATAEPALADADTQTLLVAPGSRTSGSISLKRPADFAAEKDTGTKVPRSSQD